MEKKVTANEIANKLAEVLSEFGVKIESQSLSRLADLNGGGNAARREFGYYLLMSVVDHIRSGTSLEMAYSLYAMNGTPVERDNSEIMAFLDWLKESDYSRDPATLQNLIVRYFAGELDLAHGAKMDTSSSPIIFGGRHPTGLVEIPVGEFVGTLQEAGYEVVVNGDEQGFVHVYLNDRPYGTYLHKDGSVKIGRRNLSLYPELERKYRK